MVRVAAHPKIPLLREDPVMFDFFASAMILGLTTTLHLRADRGPAFGPVEEVGGCPVVIRWIAFGLCPHLELACGR